MEQIICRIVNMPTTIKGVTILDINGDYNIYINARLGYYDREATKQHELRHIREGHFYSRLPLKALESI